MLTNEEIDKLERGIRIAIQGGDSSHDLWPDGAAKLCAMARGMLKTDEVFAEQRKRVSAEIASVKGAMVPASEKLRVRDLQKMVARERGVKEEFVALLEAERKKNAELEDAAEMACIETDPSCDCAGCLTARERNA